MAARLLPLPPIERLTALLERYISKILVRSVVTASLRRINVMEADVWPRDMERLAEEAMRGLRLWVAPERLAELMLELAELCMAIEAEGHCGAPQVRS
jgi:hypothetical protein